MPTIPRKETAGQTEKTISVSYTHLDVYKRQVEKNRNHVFIKIKNYFWEHEMDEKTGVPVHSL